MSLVVNVVVFGSMLFNVNIMLLNRYDLIFIDVDNYGILLIYLEYRSI